MCNYVLGSARFDQNARVNEKPWLYWLFVVTKGRQNTERRVYNWYNSMRLLLKWIRYLQKCAKRPTRIKWEHYVTNVERLTVRIGPIVISDLRRQETTVWLKYTLAMDRQKGVGIPSMEGIYQCIGKILKRYWKVLCITSVIWKICVDSEISLFSVQMT